MKILLFISIFPSAREYVQVVNTPRPRDICCLDINNIYPSVLVFSVYNLSYIHVYIYIYMISVLEAYTQTKHMGIFVLPVHMMTCFSVLTLRAK